MSISLAAVFRPIPLFCIAFLYRRIIIEGGLRFFPKYAETENAMRETVLFIIGMLLGGALGIFVMCALQLGARHELICVERENDEARR